MIAAMPTHYKGRPRERRALDSFIKLNRAVDSLAARLQPGLAQAGLTSGQLAVLEALLHRGPMSQRELGQKLLRSSPNMTTVIDNLERTGLLRRRRGGKDRRVALVSLTSAGRRRIERAFPAHARRIADLLAALSADEQDELGRLCKKLGLAAAGRG